SPSVSVPLTAGATLLIGSGPACHCRYSASVSAREKIAVSEIVPSQKLFVPSSSDPIFANDATVDSNVTPVCVPVSAASRYDDAVPSERQTQPESCHVEAFSVPPANSAGVSSRTYWLLPSVPRYSRLLDC